MESERTKAEPQAEGEDRATSKDDEQRLSTADIAAGGERERGAEDESAERVDEDRDEREPLLDHETTTTVRGRWETIQGSFVDEPRNAVQEADALVADLMQQLADSFASERQTLESQWDRGDKVSTEELRVALQRYRSFFDRLLTA
jgi:hypothetical protein